MIFGKIDAKSRFWHWKHHFLAVRHGQSRFYFCPLDFSRFVPEKCKKSYVPWMALDNGVRGMGFPENNANLFEMALGLIFNPLRVYLLPKKKKEKFRKFKHFECQLPIHFLLL